MNPPTPQLAAWQGAFGNAYIDRNPASDAIIALRAQGFARMLAPLCGRAPGSVLEIGANIGLNLRALQRLGVGGLQAVEPNPRARAQLIADRVLPASQVFDACAEALPFGDRTIGLVLTCTVLIHLPDASLDAACEEIHRVAARDILIAEYFSPQPHTVHYRGHDEMLFKRDYGGLFLDRFADLELLDYGFLWKRTSGFDDVNYWLLRRSP